MKTDIASLSVNQAKELEAIKKMEAGMAEAVANLDIPKVMTYYVSDDTLVLFDQMTPRMYVGTQAMIDIWTDFLENKVKSLDSYSCSEPTAWVSESGDVAGSFCFHTSDLTLLDGTHLNLTLRITHILVKENGRWVIQHEHGSFPIDWETGVPDYQSKE